MNKLKSLILFFFLLSPVACGGGSGGGSEIPGVYGVSLRLILDDCGINPSNTLNFTHSVNQDGDRVAIQSGSLSFLGEVDGDGFNGTNQFLAPNGCIVDSAYVYNPPSGNETWDVALAQITRCPGFAMECITGYVGTATRR